MAVTEDISVIDWDAGAGTDYTDLAAWDAAEAVDLPSSLKRATALMRPTGGSYDFTTVVFSSSWVTDATHWVEVRTDPGPLRHTGKWTASAARFQALDNAVLFTMTTGPNHLKFIGLQIELNDATGARAWYWTGAAAGWIYIDRCIVKSVGVTGTHANCNAIRATGGKVGYVSNLLVYDLINGSTSHYAVRWLSGATIYCHNVTVVNCRVGFSDDGNAGNFSRVYNCLAQGCTLAGFQVASGSFDQADSNCSDIASDAPGTNPQTGTVAFANAGAKDYHLLSSDTVAYANGADLSADSVLPFSIDIDGGPRVPWSIGADEGNFPQTIVLATPTVASSMPTLAVVPGPTSVALQTANLAATPVALTVVPGAKAVALQTVNLAASPVPLTVVPGARAVALQTVNLGSSAVSLTVLAPPPAGGSRRLVGQFNQRGGCREN